MKISDLKVGQGKVDVEGVVSKIGEIRSFNKFGKDLRVANAILTSDGENITLSLWNDEIDKVKDGAKIKVSNGYVSEFNGTKQLSAGKFGKIEVVDGSTGDVNEVEGPKKEKKGKKKEDKKEESEEEPTEKEDAEEEAYF